jgi:hypothetical protein
MRFNTKIALFVLVVMLGMFFLVMFTLQADAAPAPVPTGITHESTIYDAALDQTTYWYNIWPSTPAASHVVLGICGEILSVSWTPNSYGYDPTTELSGLKLDNLPELSAPLSVSVVMAGERTDQPLPWRIKAGQQIQVGETLGPPCGPNAVALSGISAENMDGRTYGYIVILFISACLGCIVAFWLSARIRNR